ncbi:hypothetical protein [Candidatus Nitrospira bockiana]
MGKWLRLANYLRWRSARVPLLLHPTTWQLRPVRTFADLPKGEWLLHRPLALPGSTRPVFIAARIRIK